MKLFLLTRGFVFVATNTFVLILENFATWVGPGEFCCAVLFLNCSLGGYSPGELCTAVVFLTYNHGGYTPGELCTAVVFLTCNLGGYTPGEL